MLKVDQRCTERGYKMDVAYILDSSILLHEPDSIFEFPLAEVIIPIAVIEEIDGIKRREDEIGRNARKVSRALDVLRLDGGLAHGIVLSNGGRLRVELNHHNMESLPPFFDHAKADNRILGVALAIDRERRDANKKTVLITKDINLRIKADALGLCSVDIPDEQVPVEETYTGALERIVPAEVINDFYGSGRLGLETLKNTVLHPVDGRAEALFLYPNEFVQLTDAGGDKSALCRYDAGSDALVPLRTIASDLCGIKSKNREQRYAMELLMDDGVKLVTLIGRAGTGKTLLAVAAAMQKVLEDKCYRKVVISRPVFPLGKDLGYLPGEKEEKLRPWMQPIFDNLEYIFAGRDKRDNGVNNLVRHLQEVGLLEMEALTYIRGRSLRDQLIIVDEAQNLSPHEVLTIITRVGEGSKIILTGDPYQIDNPYLDSCSNGLVHTVERFKRESIAGHVTLIKGERSELAAIAARVL